MSGKGKRISLTKSQIACQSGRQLLVLLTRITSDGRISESELAEIHQWVEKNAGLASEIPAIGYLREILASILVDGVVGNDEILDLWMAVERILPAPLRAKASLKQKRADVEGQPVLSKIEVTKTGLPTVQTWILVSSNGDLSPPLEWKILRRWFFHGWISPAIGLLPVTGAANPIPAAELTFLAKPTTQLQLEKQRFLAPELVSQKHPVSGKQRRVLKELGWPGYIDTLPNYYVAHQVIQDWARHGAQQFSFSYSDLESPWSWNQPATPDQLRYLEALGGSTKLDLTKDSAARLIDGLKYTAPASNRQIMVLRFWNREDLIVSGRLAISRWMDDFYQKDRDHLRAWENFKKETGDDGSQADPNSVGVGAGMEYLQSLKQTLIKPNIPVPSDVKFSCKACGQNLVVDKSGVGLEVPCPSCAILLTIPAC